MEDTLLVKRLYPYQAKITVRERGSLLESYVFQIIRHEVENTRRYERVHFWAPADGAAKVDFLLVIEQGILGIDVKAATKLKSEHLKGLRAIKNLQSLYRRVLVYLGAEPQRTEDGIDVLPIVHFADELAQSPT